MEMALCKDFFNILSFMANRLFNRDLFILVVIAAAPIYAFYRDDKIYFTTWRFPNLSLSLPPHHANDGTARVASRHGPQQDRSLTGRHSRQQGTASLRINQ